MWSVRKNGIAVYMKTISTEEMVDMIVDLMEKKPGSWFFNGYDVEYLTTMGSFSVTHKDRNDETGTTPCIAVDIQGFLEVRFREREPLYTKLKESIDALAERQRQIAYNHLADLIGRELRAK